ncbi:cytoplasm protein [Kockovaella imperatae]|uniref:Cytoplasm protein n=1 Tax=Kockovaella imperatae TaxID=4999 RepID=A0A1Y1UBS1_9TREE|nr:cytoplasm protein [Kockovaella imperatae]ORX34987.1 cytoplasm protein [Kockovaella imperatae]
MSSSDQPESDPSTPPAPPPQSNGFHAFQPVYDEAPSALSTELRPRTNATLTVRIVKSFEYRTFKAMVLPDLNLETLTVGQLMDLVRERLKTAPGFKPFRALQLDTMKVYTVAHGHKTTNLIINLENDEWILDDPSKTLAEIGAENETELSMFNRAAYEAFKANPEIKWE